MNPTTDANPVEIVEMQRALTTFEDVLASLLKNALGGSMTALVVGVSLSFAKMGWEDVWWWSWRIGTLGMAFAVLIWALGDDVVNYLRRRRLARKLLAAEAVIDRADEREAGLRQSNAELRADNSRMVAEIAGLKMRRNYVPPVTPVTDPTETDARRLVEIYYEQKRHPSKRYMGEVHSWSEKRHAAALNVLLAHGVVVARGTQMEWPDPSPALSLARLSKAVPQGWSDGDANASQKAEGVMP